MTTTMFGHGPPYSYRILHTVRRFPQMGAQIACLFHGKSYPANEVSVDDKWGYPQCRTPPYVSIGGERLIMW